MWGRKGTPGAPTPAPTQEKHGAGGSPWRPFLTSPALASALLACLIGGSLGGALLVRGSGGATHPTIATTATQTATQTAPTTATTGPPSATLDQICRAALADYRSFAPANPLPQTGPFIFDPVPLSSLDRELSRAAHQIAVDAPDLSAALSKQAAAADAVLSAFARGTGLDLAIRLYRAAAGRTVAAARAAGAPRCEQLARVRPSY